MSAASRSTFQHHHYPEVSRERERTCWPSLPVLLLWMIKDRLDLFDNMRVAAVCRDWRLASVHYPKTLHSVGDGVPWISVRKDGKQSNSRKFISVPRQCKFVVDMPEFNEAEVLFSKDGWILLRKMRSGFAETPLMVNPITGARIELPKVRGIIRYDGVFTTCGGYPLRVFLVIKESMSHVTIKAACPGEEVWTSHDFPPLGRVCALIVGLVAVGQKVCGKDPFFNRVMVLDVANNTLKDVAPPSEYGFLAERDGELIYVECPCSESVDKFAFYRYNDAATTSWEMLSNGAVMDTSWYLGTTRTGCITAKGKGLEIYHLRQKESPKYLESFVDVHDLVTGSVETRPVPFADPDPGYYLCWIGIG